MRLTVLVASQETEEDFVLCGVDNKKLLCHRSHRLFHISHNTITIRMDRSNLIVNYLPSGYTEADLEELFQSYGQILSVKVCIHVLIPHACRL